MRKGRRFSWKPESIYQRAWRAKHKEQINAKQRANYAAKKAAGLLTRTFAQKAAEQSYQYDALGFTSEAKKRSGKRYWAEHRDGISEKRRLGREGVTFKKRIKMAKPLTPEQIEYKARVEAEREEWHRKNKPKTRKELHAAIKHAIEEGEAGRLRFDATGILEAATGEGTAL